MPQGDLTMDLSWGGLILFLAFVVVSYLNAMVNRKNIDVKGEQVKNEAVGAVNEIARDTLSDLRNATQMLLSEGEKRARLEGQVQQLVYQVGVERTRADEARLKSVKQDDQITALYNQVQKQGDDLKTLKGRLSQVQLEKIELEATLAEERKAYEELMTSIEQRIEQAVSDVREQMRQHYEQKIASLEKQIREKDAQIEQLQSILDKESQSHETLNSNTRTITPSPGTSITGDNGTGNHRSTRPDNDAGSTIYPVTDTGRPPGK